MTIFARSELSRQQRWSVVLADMAQIRWCLFGLVWNVSWASPPWVSEVSSNRKAIPWAWLPRPSFSHPHSPAPIRMRWCGTWEASDQLSFRVSQTTAEPAWLYRVNLSKFAKASLYAYGWYAISQSHVQGTIYATLVEDLIRPVINVLYCLHLKYIL